MSGTLSNKVALITGSSRGIGRATALAFAKAGAAFIGVHYASNADAAQATVCEIEALGAKAIAINADLRKGKEATDSISEQFKAATTLQQVSLGLTLSSTMQAWHRRFRSREPVTLSSTRL